MADSHLNAWQKRFQQMKDDLKNLDADHLDTFIEGIANPEPPHYRKINGKVEPKLLKVSLRVSASTYHIGNVIFTSVDNEIRNVTLVFDEGEADFFTSDPLSKNVADSLSHPIADFVVVELVALWETKVKEIKKRIVQINDLRAFAHNVPTLPEPRVTVGPNLTRFLEARPATPRNGDMTLKRASNEPLLKHPANKRQRIGLVSIPDTVKSEVFARLPEDLKVQLFNNIAMVAFPNFDNLIMAAWNVVSVYEHIGTDCEELHKTVTDLKAILQEFDAVYRKQRALARDKKSREPMKNEEIEEKMTGNKSRREVTADQEPQPARENMVQKPPTLRPSSRDRSSYSVHSARSTPNKTQGQTSENMGTTTNIVEDLLLSPLWTQKQRIPGVSASLRSSPQKTGTPQSGAAEKSSLFRGMQFPEDLTQLQKLQNSRIEPKDQRISPEKWTRDIRQEEVVMIDLEVDSLFGQVPPKMNGPMARKKKNTRNGHNGDGHDTYMPMSFQVHASSQRQNRRERDSLHGAESQLDRDSMVNDMFQDHPFKLHTSAQQNHSGYDRVQDIDRERGTVPSAGAIFEHTRNATISTSMHSHRAALSLGSSALGRPKSKDMTEKKGNDAVAQNDADDADTSYEHGAPPVPMMLPTPMDMGSDQADDAKRG